jgi:predicted GNAT superfamily acetyltransferase
MQHIQFQSIHDVDRLSEIVALQKRVWDDVSFTSMHQMVAAIHHGGVVIAAIDDGKIIGFCYGFPGFDGQKAYLVSHMAAFDPDYRDRGLGKRLKEEQRRWAIDRGYDKMVWTFDPLKARNAYFNLCKLGATSKRYITAFYGELDGLPEDRLLVEWDLRSVRVERALAGHLPPSDAWLGYGRLLDWLREEPDPAPDAEYTPEDAPGYLIPVPRSIQLPERARAWRFALRRKFQEALAAGYRVTGLLRTTDEPVHYYVLEKEDFR